MRLITAVGALSGEEQLLPAFLKDLMADEPAVSLKNMKPSQISMKELQRYESANAATVNSVARILISDDRLKGNDLIPKSLQSLSEFGEDIPFLLDTLDNLRKLEPVVVSREVDDVHSKNDANEIWTMADDEDDEDDLVAGVTKSIAKEEENIRAMDDPTVDETWLMRACQVYLQHNQSGSHWTPAELYESLNGLLISPRSDDSIQNDLFELLGFESFDFISSLIQNRTEWKTASLTSSLSASPQPTAPKQVTAPLQPAFSGPLRPQLMITTESEKQAEKQARKEAKRQKKLASENPDASDIKNQELLFNVALDGMSLKQKREEELARNAQKPLFSSAQKSQKAEKYPFVFGSTPAAALAFNSRSISLPVGTSKRDEKDYEEYIVPKGNPSLPGPGERVVAIDEFEPFAQAAFKGYKSLNRIQSIIFETAYKSNENMLVCAPTGAGKTDVAMMAVLNAMRPHVDPSTFRVMNQDFKVIYVAPMKALAAEIVGKFDKRLRDTGLIVKELTGDMQLTKTEIQKTHMIVTTPEKWDVVTRKNTGDVALVQVETSQKMIRIVGLSATLPNFVDVAEFLRVNPYKGLFYFDSSFRPLPLSQAFIGIKVKGQKKQTEVMNTICYDRILEQIRHGHQVMVFVHSRKDTVRTAFALIEIAKERNQQGLFVLDDDIKRFEANREVQKSRNREMKELFDAGFGIHHAGMLRSDRNIMERMFYDGNFKVLVCTATLAWGINLPAHAVIIKGTQIYDAQKGGFMDLGILDVMQIFGRAGRPPFDTFGEGMILTTIDKLHHYLQLLTMQLPIESQFVSNLVDNLNAEVSLGTVTNVDEAVQWLKYTYLHVRMRKNPMHYGISYEERNNDPTLEERSRTLITEAAQKLALLRMDRFDRSTGYINVTDVGRIASQFYLRSSSVEVFNEIFSKHVSAKDGVVRMTEADLLALLSLASEFENIKVRDEEVPELNRLMEEGCACAVKGGVENAHGKVNILLQAYISKLSIEDFALISDTNYAVQNASRIIRALFEIAMRRGWVIVATKLLSLCKALDRRMWPFSNPLLQFDLPYDVVEKIERQDQRMSVDRLRDMSAEEIGQLIRNGRAGKTLKGYVHNFPTLAMSVSSQPITSGVLRIQLSIDADFQWNDRLHGLQEPWWILVEDANNEFFFHSEYFILTKKQAQETNLLVFTVPITDPLPSQYYVHVISDRWIGAESIVPISFNRLVLPERPHPHTRLLDLTPLPLSTLQDPILEDMYRGRFSHFNPVQTQVFHSLYHRDYNVLVGAPTGSGKTVMAELAMWHTYKTFPGSKVVYIAPLKALVRERIDDWKPRLAARLGLRVVELTGDITPDMRTVESADLIITTPEKWDGVSRNWRGRHFVQKVALVIMDEIHLLGADRGPVLEVIVSRMNHMAATSGRKIRFVGLSTALANARDLADWLGIGDRGLYNFSHSVRPVQLEVHVNSFPGKHYCPRMALMNKPAYAAIKTYSPKKPVIVFVSSRRQTRLTAMDLVAYSMLDMDRPEFLNIDPDEMNQILSRIRDPSLKSALAHGIGLHHAGLAEEDRKTVEELFVNMKIQVLVATSTLAWGVNFPAHLVVVKGTEFYDAKSRSYVDLPLTDILQMIGRAGRPQYDDTGVACIFVHDIKFDFYRKFLYEPFPVESSLHNCLHNHLNAEIAVGGITTKQAAMDFLTWTYYFRRLIMNPSYYGLAEVSNAEVNRHLSVIVESTLADLERAGCVKTSEDDDAIVPLHLGQLACSYYLDYQTMQLFKRKLSGTTKYPGLVRTLAFAKEYSELPVRHNEDLLNAELCSRIPWTVGGAPDNPHVKAEILLQCHMARTELPIADYGTDTKSVLDQSMRILQAMIDLTAHEGFLTTTLRLTVITQCLKQGVMPDSSSLLQLPGVTMCDLDSFPEKSISHLLGRNQNFVRDYLKRNFPKGKASDIIRALSRLPVMEMSAKLQPIKESDAGEPHLGVRVELTRNPGISDVDADSDRAHTPLFPKPAPEGWWIVVGDRQNDELLALKRVVMQTSENESKSRRPRASAVLALNIADDTLRDADLVVFAQSDCYFGLDQLVVLNASSELASLPVTDHFHDDQ